MYLFQPVVKKWNIDYLYFILNDIKIEIYKIFNCSYNKLDKLLSEIGQLNKLQTLLCENNNLVNLPPEIEQLVNLQTFQYTNILVKNNPQDIKKNLEEYKNHQNIYNDIQTNV